VADFLPGARVSPSPEILALCDVAWNERRVYGEPGTVLSADEAGPAGERGVYVRVLWDNGAVAVLPARGLVLDDWGADVPDVIPGDWERLT